VLAPGRRAPPNRHEEAVTDERRAALLAGSIPDPAGGIARGHRGAGQRPASNGQAALPMLAVPIVAPRSQPRRKHGAFRSGVRDRGSR
jgi:hypothetical protein